MNKTISTIIVVVIVVIGSYFLLRGEQSPAAPTPALSSDGASATPTAKIPTVSETPPVVQNVVTYTDSGYSPGTLTVKAGDTVVFKNESSRSMWTASDTHPTHRVYSGTSLGEHCPDTAGTVFDACAGIQPGDSWSFTFNQEGTWAYHNHRAPGDIGTVVAE